MNVRPTSVTPRPARRRPTRHAGFTLVEMAISLLVFGMILLLLGAIFPVATRAGHVGGNYSEASFLTQHKVDQIRNLGSGNLSGAGMVSQGLIDTNSDGTPMIVPNPVGTPNTMTSYSFTLIDNLVDNIKGGVSNPGFFPAGSTGIISIGDYHDLTTATPVGTNAIVPATVLKSVTVTITWAGSGQGNGALTVHTAIAPL